MHSCALWNRWNHAALEHDFLKADMMKGTRVIASKCKSKTPQLAISHGTKISNSLQNFIFPVTVSHYSARILAQAERTKIHFIKFINKAKLSAAFRWVKFYELENYRLRADYQWNYIREKHKGSSNFHGLKDALLVFSVISFGWGALEGKLA